MKAQTNPGRMRRRLSIEQPVETPDGAGGFVRSWSESGAVWGAVETVSGGYALSAEQAAQTVTHRIRMRWRDDLTAKTRLRDGTRVYQVRSVHNADMERRFLVALTSESKP